MYNFPYLDFNYQSEDNLEPKIFEHEDYYNFNSSQNKLTHSITQSEIS